MKLIKKQSGGSKSSIFHIRIIIASYIISVTSINKDITIFCVLFILGGCAVLISSTRLMKYVYLPAWLSGWAITLGILGDIPFSNWNVIVISIGISMLTGVLYLGVGILKFQEIISKISS